MWKSRLIQFLQEQENAALLDRGEPVRHKSPEGGLDTVGYGHKLTMGEVVSHTVYGMSLSELTPDTCYDILLKDVDCCYSMCALTVPGWDEMSPRKQAMIAEIEFNVGRVHLTFPKFCAACKADDLEGQRKEFRRFFHDMDGVRHELTRRNEAFYDTFLSDEAVNG